MNMFQNCKNTSDAVPLYLPQQLFLKPIARLNILLQLPPKIMGRSICNWEVMERLRSMIRPEEFLILKVTKTNIEFIRFEAEIDDKSKLEKIIIKLDNKMIKLKDFPELLRLRASEKKLHFPTRRDWDTFFSEAKDMNELKPGERPDTIHISNLPIQWFIPYHYSGEQNAKPSEKIFYRVFEKFGHINRIDIPICDPYRSKMKAEVSGMQMFTFDEEHFFEGYVQFKDYIGFTKTMDAFRGMKLLHKADGEIYTVNINVDFDKTKHLSDASTRRREIVRDRLVKKELEQEEKEKEKQEDEERKIQAERQKEIEQKNEKERRRQQREEKRKIRVLSKLKVKGADELNEKIAKEEKKLLKVQRKLEAIRLVEELFRRIKNKKEKVHTKALMHADNENELTRMKTSSEIEVYQQKEKLHKAIEGRVVLKNILAGGSHYHNSDDSSSSDSSTSQESQRKKKENHTSQSHLKPFECSFPPVDPALNVGDWYGYPANGVYPYQIPILYSSLRGHPSGYYPYRRGSGNISRGSKSHRMPYNYAKRLRGSRYRSGFRHMSTYPAELQEQYSRYFEKFLHERDDRHGKNYSRSRSTSRSRLHRRNSRRSKSHSYKRSRSRSRSYSTHRSKSRRSRSRTRRSVSRSRSRSRKHSSSSCRRSSSKRSNHSRCSSTSRRTPSPKRSPASKHKSRSRSVHRKLKDKSKSRSPSYRSIDSSKFISPSRLRIPRSKSWSLPREHEGNSDKKAKSWSRSPSPDKK